MESPAVALESGCPESNPMSVSYVRRHPGADMTMPA